MENIFVEFLPPWIETGRQPAFYDKESGSVLQQTARMYARVNMLIRMFNKLSKQTKEVIEEYIGKFNELHDYVDDYFANLDVQEEINNKLDQMADDGTLEEIMAQYLQTKALFIFDTIADLKTATHVIEGSYVKTLGYYSKNDRGGSIFKIEDNNLLTDDGGSVIALDNGLFAVLVQSNTINVAQFGIDNTHTSNIANFVSYVNTNKIPNVEFNNTEYNIDKGLIFDTDSITINGNGCKIMPTNETTGIPENIFDITADTIEINDVTIDGQNMPQDQWAITSHTELVLRRCFVLKAPTISIENTNIYNVWGQGFLFYNYTDVKVSNCTMDKIGGGFYTADTSGAWDYFGDAIYLSGHNNEANVLIENCNFYGYQETGARHRGSRGGIVIENLETGYTVAKTNISINNSNIIRFNRAFHVEAFAGEKTILVTNSNILQDASINTTSTKPVIKFDHCTLTQTPEDYGGTHGLSGFVYEYVDSIINIETNATYSIAMSGSTGNLIRTTINGIKGVQIANAGAKFYDCTLNYIASNYSVYSSNVEAHNCVFKNAVSTSLIQTPYTDGSPYRCYGCTFYDVYPNMRSGDLKNVFRLTSALHYSVIPNPYMYGNSTIYVGDELSSQPNIARCFLAREEYRNENTYATATFSESVTTLPVIPATLPSGIKPTRNSQYVLIINGTNDSNAWMSYPYTHCYYVMLQTNETGVLSTTGTVHTIGSPAGAGTELAIDLSGGTISKGTSSTYVNRVNYRILPRDMVMTLKGFTN